MPGELKILRYFAFGFLATPFLALIFRSGPDYSFIENLRIGFLSLIVSCPFFIYSRLRATFRRRRKAINCPGGTVREGDGALSNRGERV